MTHLLEFGRYCIALAKPRKQALLASFCKNIVNHEKKDLKKKPISWSLYHVKHIDSNK
jgi:hypothetical protein